MRLQRKIHFVLGIISQNLHWSQKEPKFSIRSLWASQCEGHFSSLYTSVTRTLALHYFKKKIGRSMTFTLSGVPLPISPKLKLKSMCRQLSQNTVKLLLAMLFVFHDSAQIQKPYWLTLHYIKNQAECTSFQHHYHPPNIKKVFSITYHYHLQSTGWHKNLFN